MLEELISDEVTSVRASNQPMFRTDINYDAEEKKRRDAVESWSKLTNEQRNEFGSQAAFENSKGVIDLKDPAILPARHYSLLSREAAARIASSDDLQLLPIDGLDFDDSVLEMAESIENAEDIRDLYKIRKKRQATLRTLA